MKKKKLSKALAGRAVKILNVSLRAEANTASCVAMYQPKVPETLSKFKRK